MAIKKQIYSEVELEWAENQLLSWKAYVDANPLVSLKDRMDFKETKTGGVIKTVIANIETQGKFIQETMKNYLSLLKEVEIMREKEEKKQTNVRGSQELNPFESGEI